jgi:hypothetical protein
VFAPHTRRAEGHLGEPQRHPVENDDAIADETEHARAHGGRAPKRKHRVNRAASLDEPYDEPEAEPEMKRGGSFKPHWPTPHVPKFSKPKAHLGRGGSADGGHPHAIIIHHENHYHFHHGKHRKED